MTRMRSMLLLAASALLLVPAAAEAQLSNTALQHFRPYDRYGLHIFEAPRTDDPYQGFQIFWGASFTQQFQALSHENSHGASSDAPTENPNQLRNIGAGFNLATANLHLGAQLADGIQVNLTTYLSSRHHPEAWVKGGYVQIDRSPLDVEVLHTLMQYVTVKAGHFEINYGDAHFRRTDNGNAIYNPFVGNLIMDAFTTEIGGEVLFRHPSGALAMVAMTGGEIQGSVLRPDDRAPSFYGKVGFDRQLQEDLRVRLTGSFYTTSSSLNNTLYSGDRAGSRYYFVMENTAATAAGNFTSGRINPGLQSEVTALVLNPFVKAGGLELFGTLERAEGKAAAETDTRSWTQLAGETIYRFHQDESLFVGARYNTVSGELRGSGADVTVHRFQLGGGWWLTPQMVLKAEYVNQSYKDFPTTDIRNSGKFSGLMVEGVISF
jgi:opacity protein-like surface antigen